MPRIIILLLFLAFIFYLLYRFRKLDSLKRKKLIKLVVVVALISLLILFALTGRLSWIIAAIGALLPLIPRAVRFFMGVWPSLMPYFQRYQQNRQSSMSTQFIRLQIDMLNGQLQGEVLQGEFAGQKLQTMSLEQLLILLQQCKQSDAESAALLVAYLNRVKPEWNSDDSQSYDQAYSSSVMDKQQAREILGVDEKASEKDVFKAHKRLIQKLHPDRGGSDYLAQQINNARDVLLK